MKISAEKRMIEPWDERKRRKSKHGSIPSRFRCNKSMCGQGEWSCTRKCRISMKISSAMTIVELIWRQLNECAEWEINHRFHWFEGKVSVADRSPRTRSFNLSWRNWEASFGQRDVNMNGAMSSSISFAMVSVCDRSGQDLLHDHVEDWDWQEELDERLPVSISSHYRWEMSKWDENMSPFDLLKVNLVFKATLTRGRVKSGK